MNDSVLSVFQITPLALALSALELIICIFSVFTSIIALWKISTFPLIPSLFRSLLFLTILRNPINIARRVYSLIFKALISGRNDPPFMAFTIPLNFFLIFSICVFCLFMSTHLFISSFYSKYAVKTDNKYFAFTMSAIAILVSIVLAICQIPGSAGYAQAIMVTLTALVLVYLFYLNNRRRKSLLSNALNDKTVLEENLRCIRLIFPLLIHEILFNAVHLSYFLFMGKIRNIVEIDTLYLNNIIGLINSWDIFLSPLVVLKSIKRLRNYRRQAIANLQTDTQRATAAYFNQLSESWK